MPPLFNVFRVVVFGLALVFALIELGLAAWLQSILEPSDLSRFVPVALFISVFTLAGVSALLFFGTRERSYPISQTRFELLAATVTGGLWLGLALFLSTQGTLEVDCPDDDDGEPSSYTTDIFHAQYHVLQAFAILEALLLLGYALFLFTLAMRHHVAGRKQVWNARVNEAQWFSPTKTPSPSSSQEKFTRLPPPVSAYARRTGGHGRNYSTPEPGTLARNGSSSSSSSKPLIGGAPLMHSRSRSAPLPVPPPSRPPPPKPTTAYPVAPTLTRQATAPTHSKKSIVTPPPPPQKAKSYVVYAPAPVPPPVNPPPNLNRSYSGKRTDTIGRQPSSRSRSGPDVSGGGAARPPKPPTTQSRTSPLEGPRIYGEDPMPRSRSTGGGNGARSGNRR